MDFLEAKITKLLIEYFQHDYKRIDHALKVLSYTKRLLSTMNGYDYDIVIACALLHDVGIKESEKRLGYNNGKTQEKYGPPIAEALLQMIDFPQEKINKVKEIIGNHHSQSKYDYIELEILKKADSAVNIKESQKSIIDKHNRNI